MAPARSVVVVIDDNAATPDVLRTLLEADGCRVECFADGAAAAARIEAGSVGLVLLDLLLPGDDGLAVCRRLRACEPDVYLPIIMVTALADAAQRRAGFAAGADDYVIKPFDADDLVARVEVWLRARCRLEAAHERLLQEQAALRDSQQERRLIIEAVHDAFIGMDAEGVITDWNHQAEVTFGLSRAEAVGRPLSELIVPPEYREPYQRLAKHFLNLHEGLAHRRVEAMMLDRHGEARPVELTLWPVSVGDSYSFNAFARDLTERKQAEETLLHSVTQLQQARRLESVGRLVGSVAHDFNNLLTVINGFSILLLEQLADESMRTYAHEIRNAGERAAVLAGQLLDLSRRPARPRVLDLNTVVADVDGLLQRLTGADVSLSTHLAPAPALVNADRGRLEQVLLNLVVNARDAMPQGGQVVVEVATAHLAGARAGAPDGVEPGEYVMLTVSDTGHGMDATTQVRAFEPFFSTKEAGGGTGLGLAIVASVVEEVGGRVQVDSTPGQGSRFHVYLPRAAAVPPTAEPTPASAQQPCGSETVLVVDPDDRVRLLVRSVLGTSGYPVLDARDGETALQVAAQHAGPVHLLVTDLVLPGATSSNLVGCLAHQSPGLRVLRTSGYPNGTAAQLDQPATPLLLKPFGPDALLRAVREALDEPAAERA